ncbi:MAG: tetratricopeptide repeat protein [Corynebacterium sp.]|nr:tetratricopeptide repeat protein [Corynebacterium sp.]
MTNPRFVGGAIDLSDLKRPATTSSDSRTDITSANFEAEVIQKSLQVPVFMHIGSQRSSDSTALDEAMLSLVAQYSGKISYAYVDADSSPDVAQAAGTQVLPTTVVLAGGQQLTRFEGNQPLPNLQQLVESILEATAGKLQGEASVEPTDSRIEEAAEEIRNGNYDAAIALYDALLEEQANLEVRKARAQAILLRRAAANGGGAHSLRAAEENPDDDEAVLNAVDFEILSGHPAQAFARLNQGVSTHFNEEREVYKTRLLELLEIFDDDDPIALDARRALASALF